MRRFLLLFFLLIARLAVAGPPATVTITGRILHPKTYLVRVSRPREWLTFADTTVAEARLDKQGRFRLTFAWPAEGAATLSTSKEVTPLWLRPGDNLTLTLDGRQFDETVRYEGSGAAVNSFLAAAMLQYEKLDDAMADAEEQLPLARYVTWRDSVHRAQLNFLANAFPRPATAADRGFRAWQRAEYDYEWGADRLSAPDSKEPGAAPEVAPTDPYYAFLADSALSVNNPAALASPSFHRFARCYVWYQLDRVTYPRRLPIPVDLRLLDSTATAVLREPAVRMVVRTHQLHEYLRARLPGATELYAQLRVVEPRLAPAVRGWLDSLTTVQARTGAGQPAPDFSATNLDGKIVKLSDLRGKLVYLDFWASWCKPCLHEIPAAKALHAAFRDRAAEVVFLNVSIDRNTAAWRKAIAQHGVEGLNVRAPGGFEAPVAKAYSTSSIPHYLLIGPDGRILDPSAPRPSRGARKAIEAALGAKK